LGALFFVSSLDWFSLHLVTLFLWASDFLIRLFFIYSNWINFLLHTHFIKTKPTKTKRNKINKNETKRNQRNENETNEINENKTKYDARLLPTHVSVSFTRRGQDLITIEQEYYAFIQRESAFYFVFISLISFRFVSFLLISFRFVSFRFVFVDFVSFRFVSFLFRFALYRYPNNPDIKLVIKSFGVTAKYILLLNPSLIGIVYHNELSTTTFL
jgi:hypothetical protein